MEIEHVIKEYSDYLYRTAYIYVKDLQLAEDIVQEVLMKLYETNTYEGRASIKTYVTKMTINCCYDYLRKQKLRKIFQFDYFSKAARATEQVVIAQHEQDDILLSVMQLPLKYREVILYYYYDDLTITEIASLLHIPASTVTTRLQRAREKLRKRLPEMDWEVLQDAEF